MGSARFPTLIYALAAIDSSAKGKLLDDAQRMTVWLSVFAWEDEPGLVVPFAPRFQRLDKQLRDWNRPLFFILRSVPILRTFAVLRYLCFAAPSKYSVNNGK